ncbi:hypothetical protein EOA13_29555 [Mesorhizobium sp. M7A.F.Ca.US.011.01.1.1]|uniref:hypothetical protein n=1 Tax=unclassified Mesorhizobium TaxID=325217 RepID=UPI000FCAB056|nr:MULTISPECIES: hypothetical protein [unclassified Mesorhizobium]RUW87706.1 hypothetical protein EOA19_32815 [Mesorhizobium sp. M7A.F.Ca.US.010.02.1.1]RUX24795.1 hypothetical protein EOA13_29555 [Mesorhizobium sp. M7A.F.Ca.US.011.01.1.1]
MTLNINKPLRVATVKIPARETASSFTVQSPRLSAWCSALTARMSGPGGAYNIGNLIGLCQGITAQILVSGNPDQPLWTGVPTAISHYLTGNFAAITMTSATAIFFASGEVYHRAWNERLNPRENLNRLGDFLSGVGAVCLGLALFELGHPLLALTSGLLHSVGKFGSACHRPGVQILNLSEHRLEPFRIMVLLSRLPALIAAGTGLCASLFKFEVGQPQHWSTPATLLVCYLLWSWADLLLFRSSQPRADGDHSAG